MTYEEKERLFLEVKNDVRYEDFLYGCFECGICVSACPSARFYDFSLRVKTLNASTTSGLGTRGNSNKPRGVRAVPNYGAVGLSKSVVESLTRYLAVELAPKGIIVNAISPGLVDTDALSNMNMDVQYALENVRRRNPTRRLVTPQDVGRVVTFLCSDAADMIVGQTIYVDGGFGLLTDYFPELERSQFSEPNKEEVSNESINVFK